MADLILLLMIARIHWLWTIAAIVVTGFAGAWLVRRQGIAVLRRMRSSFATGEIPTDPLIDGGLVLLAAGLLLTPGLITDAVGITFLIPVSRHWYRHRIKNWMIRNVQVTATTFRSRMEADTVDADYVRKQDKPFDGMNDDQRLDDRRSD